MINDKPAAIYCRVSTDDQLKEGSSLQSQKDYCRRKALDAGYAVPPENIFQEVFSGADMDRPKLTELRKLIWNRRVSAIVCYSTDRLARNPIHIAIIAEECEKRGIELLFVSEPLDKTPEGALIRYVKGYAAQMEREKIRERSMRGKKEKARQGKFSTAGPRLFGYDVIDKRRVINEPEAQVVRNIFRWFVEERQSLYQITKRLKSDNVTGGRGGSWGESTVYRLLIHPAYYGVTYAFRYIVLPSKNQLHKNQHSKVHVIRDPKDWIEIPGATPPIISKDLWDSAQIQLKANRHRSPPSKKHDYLFAGGHMRCGTCGHSMTGSTRLRQNGKNYYYYRCVCNAKSNIYAPCSQPSISEIKLETIVWGELLKILDHPDELLKCIEARHAKAPAVLEAEEFLMQDNIKKAKEEELRYLQLYGKGRISESNYEAVAEKVRETLALYEKKLTDLQSRRQSSEIALANIQNLKDSAAVYSRALRTADRAFKIKAIDFLDIIITYNPDKSLTIDGIISMGVTDLLTSSPLVKRNAHPFRLTITVRR